MQPKEGDSDFDEWFETDSQRELRQVFSVQSQMYEAIRVLSNKLDEVIGRQERTLSMLSSVNSGVGGALPAGQVPDGKEFVILSSQSLLGFNSTSFFFVICR